MKKIVSWIAVICVLLACVTAMADERTPMMSYEAYAADFNSFTDTPDALSEPEWIEDEEQGGTFWCGSKFNEGIQVALEGNPDTGDIYAVLLTAPYDDLTADGKKALSTLTVGAIWPTLGNPMTLSSILEGLGLGENFTRDGEVRRYTHGSYQYTFVLTDEGEAILDIRMAE